MARILVIDDDKQIRDVFRQILERAGYEVEDAGDGYEGVRLFKEKNIDLVITDILMPGMGGLETIMELRLASPDVKVIAISGGDHIAPEYYLNVIKNLDTLCELKKPISSKELLSAVNALL
ncbi:MAG: response regulator [Deltaproteobacteria bacterium]|nr:response regulator [Deltaproteobacteria bacterium]